MTTNKLIYLFILLGIMLCNTSCEDLTENKEIKDAPYVLALGVTSSGTTTYYVVSATDLMNETIDAKGQGVEQSGYHDYEQGNQTIFCIGGLGVTHLKGITRNASGYIQEAGDYYFNQSLSVFSQINSTTMMGMEIPANAASGNMITFYDTDINTVSFTRKRNVPIAPLATLEWPSITGLCESNGKIYVTYFHMSQSDWSTRFTDTTYVAVYDYPDMTLNKIMKDTRTGPAGSWYAHNGIFKDEIGDMYLMSNSSYTNGFSQSTKNAAFVRIPAGSTEFDNYFFDFEAKTGGLKPAHIKYLGNGLVFAEVCTVNPQTVNDRWSDKSVKCCIIDIYNKTVKDVEGIPVHSGMGGRRFPVLHDGGYVYMPITTDDGTYIYRTDIQAATAVRGAKVSASFVAGVFKLN
ncbi:MAG: DUF4374 domain-containing protein [Dysgonomonas sp.]